MFASQSQEHRRWDCRRTQHAGDAWYVLGPCHSSYVATKMRIWSGVVARALRSQNWSTHSRTNFSLISSKVRLRPDVKVHLCESLSEDRGASLSLSSLGYSLELLPPHFLSIMLTCLWSKDTSGVATSEMWELCEGVCVSQVKEIGAELLRGRKPVQKYPESSQLEQMLGRYKLVLFLARILTYKSTMS